MIENSKSKKLVKKSDFFSSNSKLIIFDYDGVIVDSLPVIIDVYYAIANEFNVEKSIPNQKITGDFFFVDHRLTLKLMGIETEKDIKRTEDMFMDIITKRRDEIKTFPFIKSFFENIKSGFSEKNIDVEFAIVSNNDTEEIKNRLAFFGLDSFFSKIIGPPEYHVLKPEPDSLIAAMKELDYNTSNTLFIGDMDGDIEAAKRAGIPVIGVTWGFHSKHKLKNADFIVNSVEELSSLLLDFNMIKKEVQEGVNFNE